MERIETSDGIVHFVHPCTGVLCLCGRPAAGAGDLFGYAEAPKATPARVTCPECAKTYCAVKNAPWSEIDGDVLEKACYAAVAK